MDWLRAWLPPLSDLVPLLATVALSAAALAGARGLLAARQRRTGQPLSLARPLVMLAVTALAVFAGILAAPVGDTLRGQLLSLLGLVLTGVFAFSSTTFVANALAGIMLRDLGHFHPGDWIRVGDQFGRVTERGLFHTEIQTRDRDLASLPNLYLATQPVTVVRASGTIVSATISLGYDLDHARIEALLVEAAGAAGLEEPFAQIAELGDHSVRYRVAGFLADVKTLLSTRSGLRGAILDTLHGAGVEIVSPGFVNLRRLPEGARFVPPARARQAAPPAEPAPEERIFDKADEKASLEEVRVEGQRLREELGALEKSGASEAELERRRARIAEIDRILEEAKK